MNLKLYLIRHGSVEANGLPDPPLSAEGRVLAAAGARLLIADGSTINLLVCSPLRRAVENANIVGKLTHSEVLVLESLEPEGEVRALQEELLRGRGEVVAVIGHLPQLKRIVSMLISAAGAVGVHFGNGGIASLEVNAEQGELKGELMWLAGREIFDILAS